MAGFKGSYAYAQIGGDSLIWANSDFGANLVDGNLNAKGHVLGLSYYPTKHFEVAFTALLSEPIETDTGNDDMDSTVYQFDLKYKF